MIAERFKGLLLPAILSISLGSLVPLGADESEEALWHYRNLGKAFYENPATQYEAVEQFEKALALAPDSVRERVNYGLALLRAGQEDKGVVELEQAQQADPSIPHTWYNLGIAYKRASDYERAVEQFEGMIQLVTDDPSTHYNLGVLYKLAGEREKAMHHFEETIRLDPSLAAPRFQLSTAYRQAKRLDDAKREMAAFRKFKKLQAGAAVAEDMEWSYYAEIYETIEARPADAVDAAPFDLARQVLGESGYTGLTLVDAEGDGQGELLAWSDKGATLFEGGGEAIPSGLEEVTGIVAVVPGDYDNDGLADLCVLTAEGAVLYHNEKGSFARSALALPAGTFEAAVWLDFDHDYDIDLFLLGAESILARNENEAGFADRSELFPFVEGRALDGVRLDLVADTQGMDLAVIYADGPAVLYRDRLAGQYEARPLPEAGDGAQQIQAFDVNSDGWTDLATAGESGATLLTNQRGAGFAVSSVAGARPPFLFADLGNRGFSDLVAADAIYRNEGQGNFVAAERAAELPAASALISADLNADGRLDLGVVGSDGTVEQWRNETAGAHHWLQVGLQGVKNLALAPGAEIEVKAGRQYQKKTYTGLPLLFGLGGYEEVDAVRITWPNGLIQNESQQQTDQALMYKEAQRLSGSCPMVFTWNGQEFEFITDVLGVAPLGASAGGGEFFTVDHDEYIQIAGSSLELLNGGYEIRITEELREISYLDQIRLIAVDHPSAIDIFTNDKFKGPPFPEFRLFGVEERVYPVSARDHNGQDVTEKVLTLDKIYPDGFERDFAGIAERHYIDLDFGTAAPDNRAVLILSGWVDWADGSTFLSAAQADPAGLQLPSLQVKDEQGQWQTVIADMGLPAGKPKTIAVDLTDKFLSDSREVRIATSLCVYWDEIFLSTETGAPQVRLTDLGMETADLRFRGFSKAVVHPQRKQPEYFVYAERQPLAMWNPHGGMYTRFGDVEPLLGKIDDLFVIMGAGDELRLVFDPEALPELPADWQRDFLLFVDGWAKDGDANTAFSQTVEPLPYHGMSNYPYTYPERYPEDGVHNRYREFYNSRPALRLIRPLAEQSTVSR